MYMYMALEMVTLQDISIQLMKPARDLADWKFPLSQILEEYYALLEKPCNVNFGEAALVLQNSTNVYVRRVERLFEEADVLKQTFCGYEAEELKKPALKEKKVLKNVFVDFENFVIVDMEEQVGGNIDRKSHTNADKKVKLLSHRFTQIENRITQLSIPIQVRDVSGEIIGNKHDFRCNQDVNMNGMLVDELTPYDFKHTYSNTVRKERNSLSSYSEPKTPGTGTSGYHSVTSSNDMEHMPLLNEEFGDDYTSALMEIVSSTDEIDNETEGNVLAENPETTSETVVDKNCSTVNQRGEKHETSLLQRNQVENCEENKERNLIQSEINNPPKRRKRHENLSKENQIIQPNDIDNVDWKEKLNCLRRKGNQTTKMSICSVDDINEYDWTPMPLIQGIKRVLSHNSPLKLPNHVALLKTKKKRKSATPLHKTECLAKFVLHDNELFARKDMILHNVQKFKHLEKEELEDFVKSLNECLNNNKDECEKWKYEAVTNIAADLLGFQRVEDNSNEYQAEEVIETNREDSPTSDLNISFSLPDYQTLIEDKMRKIFDESNITTELDQAVSKWHTSLQPKLLEAETKPVFRIHDYMSHIIKSLRSLQDGKMNFDAIVRHKPACEVARYFLASLQLANAYGIEIKTESCDKNIEIALLDTEREIEKR